MKKEYSEADKFRIRLSVKMGKTLDEIDAMPYRSFKELYDFYQTEPLDTTEYMIAQLTALTANIANPKRKSKPIDFLISLSEEIKELIKQEDLRKNLLADIEKLERT